eukprot:TRINITY_DN1249_c0_g1_i2.p1 TRINITY_DN1249_c0_g1~~TRINITY_DN1249_c0_g1_i2.p1  ORF type:complete len:221 (+),score=72.93 TRINITY_DN1249_c0_g1_i2:21-683(+)
MSNQVSGRGRKRKQATSSTDVSTEALGFVQSIAPDFEDILGDFGDLEDEEEEEGEDLFAENYEKDYLELDEPDEYEETEADQQEIASINPLDRREAERMMKKRDNTELSSQQKKRKAMFGFLDDDDSDEDEPMRHRASKKHTKDAEKTSEEMENERIRMEHRRMMTGKIKESDSDASASECDDSDEGEVISISHPDGIDLANVGTSRATNSIWRIGRAHH